MEKVARERRINYDEGREGEMSESMEKGPVVKTEDTVGNLRPIKSPNLLSFSTEVLNFSKVCQ